MSEDLRLALHRWLSARRDVAACQARRDRFADRHGTISRDAHSSALRELPRVERELDLATEHLANVSAKELGR